VIVYVNGDSHSAGAEAVNKHAFACDDPLYYSLGRQPHPDNLAVSYGCYIANALNAILDCDAEAASSNTRIIRSTKEYLETNTPDLVIIGWSTWEREEWVHNGIPWQINVGGIGDDWPDEIVDRYKDWVLTVDWATATKKAHDDIYQLHLELNERNIPHYFFNCYSDFHTMPKLDWHDCYLEPYNTEMTYWKWLTNQGHKSNDWFHFGADAHRKWAEFLLPKVISILEESRV